MYFDGRLSGKRISKPPLCGTASCLIKRTFGIAYDLANLTDREGAIAWGEVPRAHMISDLSEQMRCVLFWL
jgi:hypothetical protein